MKELEDERRHLMMENERLRKIIDGKNNPVKFLPNAGQPQYRIPNVDAGYRMDILYSGYQMSTNQNCAPRTVLPNQTQYASPNQFANLKPPQPTQPTSFLDKMNDEFAGYKYPFFPENLEIEIFLSDLIRI